MPKERKTRSDLQALIFAEMSKIRECEGGTGVTVIGVVDDRGDYNWCVSRAHNVTPLCQQAIADLERRLQSRYDLTEE